jgi:hypothetical protein
VTVMPLLLLFSVCFRGGRTLVRSTPHVELAGSAEHRQHYTRDPAVGFASVATCRAEECEPGW